VWHNVGFAALRTSALDSGQQNSSGKSSAITPENNSSRQDQNRPQCAFTLGHDYRGALLERSTDMSVKGEVKEAAGFVKEEMNEHGKSPESKAKAQEGRDLRNEGRVEDGKAPKTTKPGTGHPEK
jgi:hypothetical protein